MQASRDGPPPRSTAFHPRPSPAPQNISIFSRFPLGNARISRNRAETNPARIDMPKNKLLLVSGITVAILLAVIYGYRQWGPRDSLAVRAEMLSLMPDDASAVVYMDMAQLRSSPFLEQLFRWAPQPAPDSDYVQFLQATGFNYERDLDRLALAINNQSQNSTAFAIAEGRFDRKKIEAYAAHYGSLKTADGKTLFAVPLGGSNRKAFFVFLRDDRVAWANDSSYFFQQPRKSTSAEWREHFLRLAGTPVFAILRQDSGAAAALSEGPGGLRSPQLAALLAQLQWISIGGKPEGNLLRVGIDGECLTEGTVHQLKEVLSGIVVMAQLGLNDAKTRKRLDPEVREGYLELLQSAEIRELDRGTSKSVRVVFDVTPNLLQTARNPSAAADPPAPAH
jgi:hypothetical protein